MKTFDKIEKEFNVTRVWSWPEVRKFIKSMKKNSNVLDLGCGNGRDIKTLLENNHKPIGLDSSKKLLNIAKKRYPKAKFIHADMSKIPLKDNSIDYILSIASFHHLKTKKERLSCLKEIKRVLKPNGKLFLSIWALKGKKGPNYIMWQNKVKRYYYFFTKQELEDLFKKADLEITDFFLFEIKDIPRVRNYYITAKPIPKD